MSRQAQSVAQHRAVVPSDVRAEFEAAVATLRATADRFAALLEEEPPPTPWLSTAEAAKVAHIGSQQTIRNWARAYGLGIRVRDYWQIDRRLLDQFLRDRRDRSRER